jgi:hypothetical protein
MRGLTTEAVNYSLTSDLLPGLNLGVNYSLFQGSTLSDTARFSPFLTGVSAGMSFGAGNNPFAVLERLFGRRVVLPGDQIQPPSEGPYARQIASQPVAGRSAQNAALLPTLTKGWTATFGFSATRQRPPEGSALNVVQFDPASRCSQFNTPLYRLLYEQCVARELATPTPVTPVTSGVVGAPFYRVPNVTTLSSNLNFNVTEHWSASWNTAYDFEQRQFASQIVSLQRDLHDWRAIFAFTQSPSGSFAFNFLVSLKAEPDLKFDYHKSTYKGVGY